MKPLVARCLSIALFFCFSFQIAAFATSAPSGLVATGASSSQVNLIWTDNSTSETGFTFAYDTNSGLTSPTYTYAGGANTTSYSHTGRSAATTYYYKIKAEGNPDSAWSAVDSATTAPSGLGATATSNSAIALSWTGNGNNSAILGYTYAYATTSSFTGATYKFVADKGSSSATQTALGTATTYWFKIKVEGTSNALDSTYGTVVAATTPPAGLAASVVSTSQIALSWTGNSANPNINGYTVAYATNASFSGAVYQFVGNTTSFNHTGLSAGTTYYYKVKAEGTSNAYDSAFTASISAITSTGTVPTAPNALSATVVSSSQINLAWTDNSNNETGFEVKRASDSAFSQNVIWVGGIHASSYASTGLNPSTTYYYMVRAQGTAGSSAYSNAASATTGPGTPPPTGGVPISPYFAGINAWMPESIGTRNYGGHLEDYWGAVVESGVRIMRYGGSGVDKHAAPSAALTREQYVSLVQEMKASGIEPVLQVPVCSAACQTTHSAAEAAALVTYINETEGLGVKYWSIGNEPDLPLANEGNYGYTNASQVAAYIMQFASAMKEADSSINIIAPETAWYNTTIINGLTVCDGTAEVSLTDEKFDLTAKVPNKDYYYVDVISFHIYGFGGEQNDRDDVIDKLMLPQGFNDDLTALRARLAICNSHNGRTGDDALKIAVTEANVNHQQPANESLGATSFLGGQFWAELMGIAMQQGVGFVNFWSVAEGKEIGYIGHHDATPRPSYYHFKMVADNFRGYSIAAADADIHDRVKVFASQDVDQIVVLIMNQEEAASFNYRIRLDGGTVSGSNPLKIKVWAGVPVEYQGDAVLPPQSTIVLIFTPSGVIKRKIEYKLIGQAEWGLDTTDYPPN